MTAKLDFEGRAIDLEPGDTVASALLRSDMVTFSRGPKYHRPRGPFCLAGECGQCQMRVDGEPNVASCTTPARDGLQVERQNVLGSGDHDLLRAVDELYRKGIDHHHLLTQFRVVNLAAQAVARRLAGIGELPRDAVPTRPARTIATSVLVVGAGPAGLAAAREAHQAGRTVVVAEADAWAEISTPAGIDVRRGLQITGIYDEGGAVRAVGLDADGLVQILPERVVIATGGHERPMTFESNDLPGVFGARGLLRLAQRQHVRPGKTLVVVGSDEEALTLLAGLRAAGWHVVALLDPTGRMSLRSEVPVVHGTPVRALGRRRVEGLRVVTSGGGEETLPCDTVAIAAALEPAWELAGEVGARVEWHPSSGGFRIVVDEEGRTSVPWLLAAGWCAGEPVDAARLGAAAGRAAVRGL